MNYRLVFPIRVERSIYESAAFIAEDSPTRAIAWVEKLKAQAQKILQMPEAYPIAEAESIRLGLDVRKRVFGEYLLFYTIDEQAKQVIVVEFRHGARR